MTQLVEAMRYKPEGHGVRFPMVSLEVLIDIILSAALWPLRLTQPLTEMRKGKGKVIPLQARCDPEGG